MVHHLPHGRDPPDPRKAGDMPRIIETWFDERFASRRSGLVETVRQHLPTQQPGLEAVGTWLDTEYSEPTVRGILERRRQEYRLRDAGQPTPPDGRRIPGSGYRDPGLPGDSLRADRLEQAFTALYGQNQGGDLLRLLGRNLPQNEGQTNALRAVVVSACIVDPDADKWLATITLLAGCPWRGDSPAVPPVKGRVDVDRRWGHEALKLLQEACSVLGWEPAGSSTPSTTTLGDGGESFAGEPVLEAVDRTKQDHAAKLQVVADRKPDDITRRASTALALRQFGKALIMDYRVFKSRAEAEWDLQADEDLKNRWTIDYNLLGDPGKERQIEEHAASLRDKPKKT